MAKKVQKGNKGQGKKVSSGGKSAKRPAKTGKPGSKNEKLPVPGEGVPKK